MATPSIGAPRSLGRRSGFRPPPGAWDSHCHVFGPQAEFPYAPQRSYTPHNVPVGRLLALHDLLGFQHAVLVQPAAHGRDHRALLDALHRANGRYRGVILTDDDGANLPVEELHGKGIRAVRYNLLPHLGDMPDMGHVRAVASKIRAIGWHLCLHLTATQLHHLDAWLDLGVPLVIDHMGRLDLASATAERDLDLLTGLLARPALFVKLSAVDRLAKKGAPYEDGVAVARRLFEAAPQKCLWGTDFPHPNHAAVPDDAELVDLIPRIAPTTAEQEMLLIENPARLYS